LWQLFLLYEWQRAWHLMGRNEVENLEVPGEQRMSGEQNKAVVRQLIEQVFNQGNMAMMDELVAADFVEHEEMPPGIPEGREGVELMTGMLRGAFPDFQATIEELIAEGDKVVLRMTWSGTQEGEFMGIPPSGKRFTIAVIDIMHMDGGKIAEHWGLMDMMGMMQQLGAMPAPE
jgi:steroid delta-isomerase-like uncharacterized protein